MSAARGSNRLGDQLRGGAAVTEIPAEPETELTILFRREVALERQLRDVRDALPGARRRYAEKHRLGIFPSLDRLRELFGADR